MTLEQTQSLNVVKSLNEGKGNGRNNTEEMWNCVVNKFEEVWQDLLSYYKEVGVMQMNISAIFLR
jgi:hypothetical protein